MLGASEGSDRRRRRRRQGGGIARPKATKEEGSAEPRFIGNRAAPVHASSACLPLHVAQEEIDQRVGEGLHHGLGPFGAATARRQGTQGLQATHAQA